MNHNFKYDPIPGHKMCTKCGAALNVQDMNEPCPGRTKLTEALPNDVSPGLAEPFDAPSTPTPDTPQSEERDMVKRIGRIIDTHSGAIANVQSMPVGAERIAAVFKARLAAVDTIMSIISAAHESGYKQGKEEAERKHG